MASLINLRRLIDLLDQEDQRLLAIVQSIGQSIESGPIPWCEVPPSQSIVDRNKELPARSPNRLVGVVLTISAGEDGKNLIHKG